MTTEIDATIFSSTLYFPVSEVRIKNKAVIPTGHPPNFPPSTVKIATYKPTFRSLCAVDERFAICTYI